MDDLFDRQLRVGLRELIDPVTGEYPRWEASPAGERVGRLPAHPRFGPGLDSNTARRLAWLVAAAALLLLALLGFVLVPGSAPVPPAYLPCPIGTAPDTPGPIDQARPASAGFEGSMFWNSAANRLVLLPLGGTSVWTFDVCTNTWQAMEAKTKPQLLLGVAVVYDEGSDLTVAVGNGVVETYDFKAERWTREATAPMGEATAVFDPVSGLVIVRDSALRLWSYDVETDTWAELPQGPLLPPDWGTCNSRYLDYDRAVDRIVLMTGPCPGPETWLFDLRSGRWTKAEVVTPQSWDYLEHTDLMVYDSVNARSVVYAGGRVAAYDAAANSWDVLFEAARPPGWVAGPGAARYQRHMSAIAFDPRNGRLVVVGGRIRSATGDFRATDDVVAFDIRTRSWIELLAPSGEGTGA